MTDADAAPPRFDNDEAALTIAVADLRALTAGDLTEAELWLRTRRLVDAGGLDEVLTLVGDALTRLDEEAEGTEEVEESDTAATEAAAGEEPPLLTPFAEVVARGRERSLAEATTAIDDLLDRDDHRGAIAFVIAGGPVEDRRRALTSITDASERAGRPLSVLDAGDDPFLRRLDEERQGAVAIFDADLAPLLLDQIVSGDRRAYVVLAPDGALRSLGERLLPDQIVDVFPSAPPGPTVANGTPPPAALPGLLAVGGESAPATSLPALLPSGPALTALITDYLRLAEGDDDRSRAAEALKVLRRLSLGRHAAETRRALAALDDLDVRFRASEPDHVLAWSALYRDLGLLTPARRVLQAAWDRGLRDDLIRHARAQMDVLMGHAEMAIAELESLPPSAHRAHALARAYRLAGRLDPENEQRRDAATPIVEAGLHDYPDNLYLLIEAGMIHARAGRPQVADARFLRARQVSPRCGAVLNAWGGAAALAGDPERAERLFRQAAALEPWNDRHTLELANLAKSRGLVAEAEETLLPLRDNPDPVIRRRALVQLIDGLLNAAPRRRAEARTLLADLANDLAADPDRGSDAAARLASLRISLLRADGDHAAALAVAESVETLDQPYLLAQKVAAKLSDPDLLDSAAADLRRLEGSAAARANPQTRRVATALRARLLTARRRWEAARELLRDALAAEPRQPVMLNALAEVERLAVVATAGDDARAAGLIRAEALARSSLEIDPRNAYTHRLLARLLDDQDRPSEAEPFARFVRVSGLAVDSGRQESFDPVAMAAIE